MLAMQTHDRSWSCQTLFDLHQYNSQQFARIIEFVYIGNTHRKVAMTIMALSLGGCGRGLMRCQINDPTPIRPPNRLATLKYCEGPITTWTH